MLWSYEIEMILPTYIELVYFRILKLYQMYVGHI